MEVPGKEKKYISVLCVTKDNVSVKRKKVNGSINTTNYYYLNIQAAVFVLT